MTQEEKDEIVKAFTDEVAKYANIAEDVVTWSAHTNIEFVLVRVDPHKCYQEATALIQKQAKRIADLEKAVGEALNIIDRLRGKL